MDTYYITDYDQLKQRIMHLKWQRIDQKEKIIRNVKTLYHSFYPSVLIKNTLRKLLSGSEVRPDIAKAGINTLTDFLIGKIFGRGRSIKGYISSLLIGKIANYTVNNWSDSIYTGIGKIRNYMSDHFQIQAHNPKE